MKVQVAPEVQNDEEVFKRVNPTVQKFTTTKSGIARVTFSKEMKWPRMWKEDKNRLLGSDSERLRLQLKTCNDAEGLNKVKVPYSFKTFGPEFIEMKMEFESPKDVSLTC